MSEPITITLDGYTSSEIDEALVNRLLRQYVEEHHDEQQRIGELIRQAVKRNLDEMVREMITPVVEEALEQPIQRTNSYGAKVGEPIGYPEFVKDTTERYLTERVTGRGEKTTSREAQTRAEYLMRLSIARIASDTAERIMGDQDLTGLVAEAITEVVRKKAKIR